MLVLSRKANESLCISDNVVVRVVKIHGNRVQLGIDAPIEVSIQRMELVSDDRNASRSAVSKVAKLKADPSSYA